MFTEQMSLLVIIMMISGAFGGIVAFFAQKTDYAFWKGIRQCLGLVLSGVAAALSVPLFFANDR